MNHSRRHKSDGDVVAVAAARTAFGSFGGTLRDIPASELGAKAIMATTGRVDFDISEISSVIFANCRQAGNGPNPARTAAVKAGIPAGAQAYTVNMACPSGMKTVMLAARELAATPNSLHIAGGMESMSTMPYLLMGARWEGFKLGDRTLLDGWSDTVDPLCGFSMGVTAENLARKYCISRESQDEYALASHRKASSARHGDRFKDEIVAIDVPVGKAAGTTLRFDQDEAIRDETSLEKLARLRPAFEAHGTVTAGNACSMADGACAILLTTRGHARALSLPPLFSIAGFGEAAVDPAFMGEGPGLSIPRALDVAGMTLNDMDFIEVNEAFAAQTLANERVLGWNSDKVNVWGGAIALGHPTGVSGARLLVTLNSVLHHNNREWGVAGICGGGGVTTAMVIRREN